MLNNIFTELTMQLGRFVALGVWLVLLVLAFVFWPLTLIFTVIVAVAMVIEKTKTVKQAALNVKMHAEAEALRQQQRNAQQAELKALLLERAALRNKINS